MHTIRLSTHADVPALRELWTLAFGDGGAYLDNFFSRYYAPERMIVLEEEGQVLAMTAWFDTTFVVPGEGEYRAAYLYAVATHPHFRGKGLAGELLAWADDYFRTLSIPAVTTVPAEPSLHSFFAANGFRECFVLQEEEFVPTEAPACGTCALHPVTPAEYGVLREELLAGTPHIAYPAEALAYQEGCCAIGGLGLWAAHTPAGPVCLCPEDAGEGLIIAKEFLGSATAKRLALSALDQTAPGRRWLLRSPGCGAKMVKFAMLKWLEKTQADQWNWASTAYLGLAFD